MPHSRVIGKEKTKRTPLSQYKVDQTRNIGIQMNQKEFSDDFKLKRIKSPWIKPKQFSIVRANPLTAKLFNLNFHPLEVVSC